MSNSNSNETTRKNLSKQRFGEFAESYVTSQTHAKGEDLKLLLQMANPQPNWRVLDVATGGGHTALLLAPAVASVIATDISSKMLEAARSFILGKGIKNVSFQKTEADQLPFEPVSFDLITCRIATHHFPSCQAFINETCKVLKPGGYLLIQDHFLPESDEDGHYIDGFERLRDPSHNRAYSKSAWKIMFSTAGFDVLTTEEIIKQHEFHPWCQRQRCSAETKTELLRMLKTASPVIQAWMQPRLLDSETPSFVNHQLLILGRKN